MSHLRRTKSSKRKRIDLRNRDTKPNIPKYHAEKTMDMEQEHVKRPKLETILEKCHKEQEAIEIRQDDAIEEPQRDEAQNVHQKDEPTEHQEASLDQSSASTPPQITSQQPEPSAAPSPPPFDPRISTDPPPTHVTPSYVHELHLSFLADQIDILPTFYPTLEQFQDFAAFIEYISPIMEPYGAAHIVPPPEFVAVKSLEGRLPTHVNYAEKIPGFSDMVLESPTTQNIALEEGSFEINPDQNGRISLSDFIQGAKDRDPPVPQHEIHEYFWDNATELSNNDMPSVYGTDVHDSLIDTNLEKWNLNNLPQCLLRNLDYNIEGVTSSFLYFGQYASAFAWHHEDMSLYSTSYLHFGDPKIWYVIPRYHSQLFEKFCAKYYPHESENCQGFLKHKHTLVDPRILAQHDIQVYAAVHIPNSFIVTSPNAYHGGFNSGFNCAEAVNFALQPWMQLQLSNQLKERKCLCDFYTGKNARWYIDVDQFNRVIKGESSDTSSCLKFYITEEGAMRVVEDE